MKTASNSRGQGVGTNWFVIVLVSLIVLGVVLMFIYRADILNRLRQTPGYDFNQKEKVVDITKDAAAAARFCPIKVGNLMTPGSWTVYSKSQIFIGGQQTSLWIYTGDSDIELPRVFANPVIGTIDTQGVIHMDSSKFGKYDDLPSTDKLTLLDGAYLYGNNICRKS